MNNKLDKHQMFLDNEKLIYFTMKKYFPYIYNDFNKREDYYQIGAIALLKAIDTYNSNISRFSTYGVKMIWGEMKRNIRDTRNLIHYSRNIVDISNNIIASYYSNQIDDGFDEWVNTHIRDLDISDNDKLAVLSYLSKEISLSTPTKDDDSLCIADSVSSNNDTLDNVIYKNYIDNIAKQLNDKEKMVFLNFLKGYEQRYIANIVDLSQPRVSRIQMKIKKLLIKELYEAKNYTLAFNMLSNVCTRGNIFNANKFLNECKRYRLDINKCPKQILNNINTNITQCNSFNEKQNNNNDNSCNDKINVVISLLERFKRDNLLIKF